MFAILIAPENLESILQYVRPTEDKHPDFDIFLASATNWYVITGFTTQSGKFIDWIIYPEYMLRQDFEYDADKIKTEWDQLGLK